MRRVLALIGVPGSGKSSAVRAFMRASGALWDARRLAPLLKGHVAVPAGMTVIGDYSDEDEVFPGTDRLSMACAPAGVEWIRNADCDVLFEGDRLGNASTLRLIQLLRGIELRVWCMEAPASDLIRRYALRGSAQHAKWLQARQAKVANICNNPNLGVERRQNRNREDHAAAVRDMLAYFGMRVGPW